MKAPEESQYWEGTGIDQKFNWNQYSIAQGKFIDHQAQQNKELREAMQWFCDRVDKGEVRSKRTYKRFKELLNK